VDHVLGDRHVGDLLLTVLAFFKHHLEGDEEQKQAARHAEGRQGDAENRQDQRAGQRKQRHHRKADH
jgi:hypothetical protein